MGAIKGMTVRIGGDTSELNEAIRKSNAEIKSTEKELKEVNKLLKLDPTNTELLKQKQQLLAQQIGQTSNKLQTLKEKQKLFDDEIKKGGNVSQEQYRKLEREITDTEISLGKLKDEAKATNPQLEKLKQGLQKAGEVAKNVASVGFDLTVVGIKAMATACVGAITSIGTLAVKSGQLADDLNTMASVTGLSTKQLQEFAYASDLIDVSTETLSSSLKKLISNMSTAKKGSGDAYDTFKQLGVEFQNADGTLRNSNDVFNDTIRALGNVANETERDALAMKLFGKSATDLNPLIEGGIDTLEQMSKQANDLGLILSQEALDGANAFNDQLDILKSNGKGLFNVIGTEIASNLAPAMQQLNEYTMEVIKNLTTALNEGGLEGLAEKLSTQIGEGISKLIENLPKVAEFGTQIIEKLVEGIKANAGSLGSASANLVSTLVEGFYTLLPDLLQIAIDFIVGFGKTLAENLPTLIPIIQQGVLDALQTIIDNLPLIIETVVDIIVAIVDAMTQPESIEMIIEGSITLMVALAEGLVKAIPKLIEAIPLIVMALVRGFVALATELYKVAEPFIIALKDGIISKVEVLREAIVNIWEFIKTTLSNAFKGVTQIGKNLIEGLWNGIKNAKDWLINKIKSLCSDALRSNKELLWN